MQLLAKRFDRKIRPGLPVRIDKPKGLDAQTPKKFDVRVTWYPEKDRLRAVVNAVDPHYASCEDKEKRSYRAYFDLFVCASGADQDILQVHVIEGEESGKSMCRVRGGGRNWSEDTASCPVKSTWNRTADGFKAEVRIPWSAVPGYRRGWSVLPVEAQACSVSEEWAYFQMTKSGDPETSARSYSLLTRK